MSARRNLRFLLILLFLLHVYLGLRLLPDLGLGVPGWTLGIALLGASTVLQPIGLLSATLKRGRWSDALAWCGLLAMGWFSSLLVLSLLRDLALLLASWCALPVAALAYPSALAGCLLALGVSVVGFVNARRVAQVKRVDVPIAGLPAALHGYAIAQISDIHVGPTIQRPYLEAIVERVNRLQPDAIAVTGNHEYYSGAEAWIAEIKRLGLTVWLNEHVLVQRGDALLMIAGVADYSAHQFNPAHRSDPHRAAAGAPPGVAVKILLAH